MKQDARTNGAARSVLPHRAASAVLAVAVVTVLLLVACSSSSPSNPDYDASRAHHRPDGFVNSDGAASDKPFSSLLRWQYERWRDDLPPVPSTYVQGYAGFPVVKPELAPAPPAQSPPRVTWIGHATLLVQVNGFNVLTDPHFSERAFAVQWIGPRRKVPLPMTLAELPHIDLVVISHNHYDHLDSDTVKALAAQPGGPPLFAVPLGVDRWMRDQGIERVQAFDWWGASPVALPQASTQGDEKSGWAELVFVPVHHWSSRTPFDRNETLWGGWVLRTPGFSFFFVGDTGYSADFKQISERFGGFDLAAIPVGAYEPRWFMSAQHVDPAQAVQIHKDLGARHSIGIHWGTFELTDEALDAPIGDLATARTEAGVSEAEFGLLKHGESWSPDPR